LVKKEMIESGKLGFHAKMINKKQKLKSKSKKKVKEKHLGLSVIKLLDVQVMLWC
jgi:hypothetical protein